MSDTEIYSIVRDVPKHIWLRENMNADSMTETVIVGLMLAWLIGEGFHCHKWDSDSDAETATLILYDRRFTVSTRKYRGMRTILALYAEACKDISQ